MPKKAARPARRSIATRKGDDGTTGLLYGQRVAKDHPQVETVGAIDELNAALGVAKAAGKFRVPRATLDAIQRDLVALMGEVACAEKDAARFAKSSFPRIDARALARLDQVLADVEGRQPAFDGWATPGKNAPAAALDLARTVARRAERRLVELRRHGRRVRPVALQYLNRLSDLLWILAREAEGA
ncbi:MAG TPA: cob(I)yrinic acid a,c-diamide adenosyltransferase [Opitutaceae bacterium]|nr:cob(I)yrinic acid a,c-diamide adenosyltransferase [Opitutaceae bacterium]